MPENHWRVLVRQNEATVLALFFLLQFRRCFGYEFVWMLEYDDTGD
jgi:hypothetical protein